MHAAGVDTYFFLTQQTTILLLRRRYCDGDKQGSAMPMFDFITEKDLRVSLEGDYAEMQRCVEASAWKSVQVLAGSIVEALLVDYLVATPNPARVQNNPLRIDLADAITICRTEKVLSDRSVDLCSVIRSYRNLIHPGRMLRLAEAAPTNQSSAVAGALIDMIVEDFSQGPTRECRPDR